MGDVILSPKDAFVYHRDQRMGSILVKMGRLTPEQVEHIVEHQFAEKCNFGKAAIRLEYLTQDDVEIALAQQFDYAILSSKNDTLLSEELVIAFKPFEKEAETFRALRSKLMLNCFERGGRALAVVTPNAASGATFVAVNLALSLAQLGVNVCLVEANLRDPRIGEIFGIPRSNRGLAHVLGRRVDYDQVVITEKFPGLAILVAGQKAPNPQELLSGVEFVRFVSRILRDFEVAIFDTPAANTCADSHIIAARVGAALMVTRKDRTPVQDVEVLTRELDDSGCELVGSVLNEF